jgi:hypothetical protein
MDPDHMPAFLMLLGLLAGGTLLAGGYWFRDHRVRVRQRRLLESANDPAPTEATFEASPDYPTEVMEESAEPVVVETDGLPAEQALPVEPATARQQAV